MSFREVGEHRLKHPFLLKLCPDIATCKGWWMKHYRRGLKPQGSFSFLNEKVDLSTCEAEPTFAHWTRQLQRLRQETSLRSINRDLNSVERTQAWRLLVRRNGEGYRGKPEMIVGSSVTGVLDQCSHKLGITSAARRLYTEDGTQILHMDQLKQWIQKVGKDVRKDRTMEQVAGNTSEEREEGEKGNTDVKNDKANDGTNSTEGTPDHSTTEYGTQDLTMKGRKSKDLTRTVQETSVEIQSLPIVEVWVSCGENFIKPSVADKMSQDNLAIHSERNAKNLILDTQRHVIRQLHGRRRGQMNPKELLPTKDSKQPVMVSGGWAAKTKEEDERQAMVDHLKETQKPKRPKSASRLHSGIYKQPQMKRIVARPIDDQSVSVYAWGSSLEALLEDASTRLGFRKTAKLFRTGEGRKIQSFEEIERDVELYLNPMRPGSTIRMKTVWARTRKSYGRSATEIVLNSPTSDNSLSYVLPTNQFIQAPEDQASDSD